MQVFEVSFRKGTYQNSMTVFGTPKCIAEVAKKFLSDMGYKGVDVVKIDEYMSNNVPICVTVKAPTGIYYYAIREMVIR